MGLPARQEKVLETIESALRAEDPKLAGLYATFARLTTDEEIPRIEQLRDRAGRLLARLRRFAAIVVAAALPRRRRRRRVVLFLPLAIAVVSMSIVFAVRSGGSPGCTTAKSASAVKSLARSRRCTLAPAYVER